MKRKLTLALSLALLSSVHAFADVQTITLNTCYVATPPVLTNAVDGTPDYTISWDAYYRGTDQTDNDTCDNDGLLDQTLTYSYAVREQDELIITSEGSPTVTQTFTKTTITTQSYVQPGSTELVNTYDNNCETREQFAAEALQYFQGFYHDTIQLQLCQ